MDIHSVHADVSLNEQSNKITRTLNRYSIIVYMSPPTMVLNIISMMLPDVLDTQYLCIWSENIYITWSN